MSVDERTETDQNFMLRDSDGIERLPNKTPSDKIRSW
jgi:hypothetical protein